MGDRQGLIEKGRADVGGGRRLSFEIRGAGRPLVLVHGGLLGHRLWDAVIAPLSRRYRVHRFDQRGYGESDRPSGPYAYWEDLSRLLDGWKLESASFIGFGEGGAAVLDLALASPGRVAGMVLVSSYLHGYDYAPAFQMNLQKLADAYLTTGASAVADALMKDDRYPPPASKPEERRRLRDLIVENAQVLAFNWMHLRPLDPLAAGRLGEVKTPTLVVSGERDGVDNLNVADRLGGEIPGARHVSLPGGHVLPVELPGELVEQSVGFLGSLKRPSF